jgi:hypothetical protein
MTVKDVINLEESGEAGKEMKEKDGQIEKGRYRELITEITNIL